VLDDRSVATPKSFVMFDDKFCLKLKKWLKASLTVGVSPERYVVFPGWYPKWLHSIDSRRK